MANKALSYDQRVANSLVRYRKQFPYADTEMVEKVARRVAGGKSSRDQATVRLSAVNEARKAIYLDLEEDFRDGLIGSGMPLADK